MLDCVQVPIFGLAWAGRWFTRPAPHPCRFVATLALALHSSFGGIVEVERRKHEYQDSSPGAVAGLGTCAVGPSSDSTRRYACRRHDLKFLSLRGETTPRTPVWRSIS